MFSLELTVLGITIVVALSIVWTTVRTGISPMMSSRKACNQMISFVLQSTDGDIIDLGSGWGTVVVALARKAPRRKVVGYELSWFPWTISFMRKKILGLHNLTLYRKDFRSDDLTSAQVLLCYLFPKGMETLAETLSREFSTDVYIISNTFALPQCVPLKTVRIDDMYKSPIYFYRWTPIPLQKPSNDLKIM